MPPLPVLLANGINPVLASLLLPAPFLSPRRPAPWDYWRRSGLGIGLAVLLAESGKHFQVWGGHPSFPSGHETFGLGVATCLVLCDHRWLGLALALTLLLAWALVAAGFHQPVDVAGALLLGPPCALLCHRRRNENTESGVE